MEDFTKLNDQELAALHARVSGAVRDRKPVQLEDIKPGMKPEDIARARQKINEVLAALR